MMTTKNKKIVFINTPTETMFKNQVFSVQGLPLFFFVFVSPVIYDDDAMKIPDPKNKNKRKSVVGWTEKKRFQLVKM